MPTFQELWHWGLANPARLMVLLSIAFTLVVGLGESGGRNSGGSGWLTLARFASGAVFTLLTVIVASVYGGVRGFFVYGTLQVLVCFVIPALWLEEA